MLRPGRKALFLVNDITTPRPADLELSVPARPENVAIIRHVLGGMGDALGMDALTVADLRLAVSEACTNVVIHAYDDEDAAPEIAHLLEVEASIEGKLLSVTVRDHGRGMRERSDSPGLGLGLPIVRAVSDSVEFGESDAGNEVRMAFVVPG